MECKQSDENMTTDRTPETKRQMEDPQTMDELRIVLFGRKFPKNDLFKIIHDAGNFKPDLPPEDGTQQEKQCQEYHGHINDRNVVIIDTPGVDTGGKDKPKVLEEIKWSVAVTDPGPHVFLFVETVYKPLGDKLKALKDFQQIFGEQANDFTMMVFITDDENEKNIKPFRELTYPFNHRYFIFISEDDKQQQQQESQQKSQVTELLEKTAEMRGEESERVYTPKMLWEAEKAVKQQEEEEHKQEEEKQKQEEEKLKQKEEMWSKVRDKLYVIGAHLGATIGFLLSACLYLDSSAAGAVGSIVGVIIVVLAYLVVYHFKFNAKQQSDSKQENGSMV